jgi:hypothetical protein
MNIAIADRRFETKKIEQRQHEFLDRSDGRTSVYNIVDSVGSFANGLTDEELKDLVRSLREESLEGFDKILGALFSLVAEGK